MPTSIDPCAWINWSSICDLHICVWPNQIPVAFGLLCCFRPAISFLLLPSLTITTAISLLNRNLSFGSVSNQRRTVDFLLWKENKMWTEWGRNKIEWDEKNKITWLFFPTITLHYVYSPHTQLILLVSLLVVYNSIACSKKNYQNTCHFPTPHAGLLSD